MADPTPGPSLLYHQAEAEMKAALGADCTQRMIRARYTDLMIEHGHLTKTGPGPSLMVALDRLRELHREARSIRVRLMELDLTHQQAAERFSNAIHRATKGYEE